MDEIKGTQYFLKSRVKDLDEVILLYLSLEFLLLIEKTIMTTNRFR